MRTFFAIAFFAVGCSTVTVEPESGVDTSPIRTIKPAPCDVRIAGEAGAEAKARDVLAEIAPGATMTFSSVRGTPATIYGMDLVLHDCATTKTPLRESLVDFVKTYPDLFRIDPSEWDVASPSCEGMLDTELVSWNRATYGGFPVRADRFAVQLRKKGDAIVIGAVIGTYVPFATKKAVEAMAACPKLDVRTAAREALSTKYPYSIFQWCTPQGAGVYEPNAADVFAPLEAYWEWSETQSDVVFGSRQKAALRVDPSNHTPELVSSDANCSWNGTNNIAFTLFFDAAKSTMISNHPGEGCVVCAR